MDLVSRDNGRFANTAANLSKVVCLETPLISRPESFGLENQRPRAGKTRKSAVCGLNGHRLYYIMSLLKVTYKSTIELSRNFHALFTKTLENSDTCD